MCVGTTESLSLRPDEYLRSGPDPDPLLIFPRVTRDVECRPRFPSRKILDRFTVCSYVIKPRVFRLQILGTFLDLDTEFYDLRVTDTFVKCDLGTNTKSSMDVLKKVVYKF